MAPRLRSGPFTPILCVEFVTTRSVCRVIVYSLHCPKGHAFEGWFRDSVAFDAQSADGKLVCPVCNSRKIEKAPMAPALGEFGRRTQIRFRRVAQGAPVRDGLAQICRTNAEFVGPKFPEEARKIHYGETEERHIYGEATIEEARELIEEGVDVAPLPPDLSEAN